LRALDIPVVCAVNGVAAGAGANLALACDIVIASAVGELIQAFRRSAHSRLRRHLFPAAPRRRGARAGLSLSRVTSCRQSRLPNGGLSGNASTMARCTVVIDKLLAQLAQGPTPRLGAIKAAIHASASNTLALQLDSSATCSASSASSDDYREGVAAFTAKRPPKFTGARRLPRTGLQASDDHRAAKERHRRRHRLGDTMGAGDRPNCRGQRSPGATHTTRAWAG
jgi:2-(1,2-epoxy-1,2-dihydrophenyl)acetyl-CoA isomerase